MLPSFPFSTQSSSFSTLLKTSDDYNDLEYEFEPKNDIDIKIKSKRYSNYNNFYPIGKIDSLNPENFEEKINKLLFNFNEGDILTIIPTILYKDEYSVQKGLSIKSIKINNKTNLEHLYSMILAKALKLANEYTLELPDNLLILK